MNCIKVCPLLRDRCNETVMQVYFFSLARVAIPKILPKIRILDCWIRKLSHREHNVICKLTTLRLPSKIFQRGCVSSLEDLPRVVSLRKNTKKPWNILLLVYFWNHVQLLAFSSYIHTHTFKIWIQTMYSNSTMQISSWPSRKRLYSRIHELI